MDGDDTYSHWYHPRLPWDLAAKFTKPNLLDEEKPTEGMGTSLDALTFKFYVKASFRLTQ